MAALELCGNLVPRWAPLGFGFTPAGSNGFPSAFRSLLGCQILSSTSGGVLSALRADNAASPHDFHICSLPILSALADVESLRRLFAASAHPGTIVACLVVAHCGLESGPGLPGPPRVETFNVAYWTVSAVSATSWSASFKSRSPCMSSAVISRTLNASLVSSR